MFEIKRENKTKAADMSSKMRAYMKIHGSNFDSYKNAIMNLKSKVDSDGEELSDITSGINIDKNLEEDNENISLQESIDLDDAEEAGILAAVTELNTE
jgi:hypothetical protein